MSDLVSAPVVVTPSLLAMLTDPAGGSTLTRLRGIAAQPAVRRAMPWFGGMAAIGALALAYAVLSPAPQRILYGQLDDSQRADIASALDKASIPFRIDNGTGALTVNEEDLYRARMTVASEGALATPESGIELLDSLPLGASRTMEGERLRAARERELMLTIREIDGVEAVRVHLAEPEQSPFVRESAQPSASVMVRLANGRQLSDAQVTAIANLVANSVSGLPLDNVRIVDQHGRLLSQDAGKNATALELQTQIEEKLRSQVGQLLSPVLGPGNFTSEVQVELDMEERTAARESYDRDGALRTETQESSRRVGSGGAAGIPGMTSNTPPPPATAQPGAPQGTQADAPGAAPMLGETRASRSYELGREVAVSNVAPGSIKRMSVAVALSSEAMKKSKAADVEKIKALVSAAVGADPSRGDQVEVLVRSFAETELEEPAFYETGWFASLVRYGATLIGLLLVLLLGVRPILRAFRNADRAMSGLSLADSAIQEIADNLIRAQELATQAANGTLSAEQRAGIAEQLANIRSNLIALANSKDSSGHSLFGGEASGDAYTLDASGNPVYAGTANSGELPLGDGQTIVRGVTGPEFLSFNHAGGATDLFAVLGTLSAALSGGSGDPGGAARDALDAMAAGLQKITTTQTVIGGRMNWVDLNIARYERQGEMRATEQADIGSIDAASAITELQQIMTVLEASQASFARLASLSLFDVIR